MPPAYLKAPAVVDHVPAPGDTGCVGTRYERADIGARAAKRAGARYTSYRCRHCLGWHVTGTRIRRINGARDGGMHVR